MDTADKFTYASKVDKASFGINGFKKIAASGSYTGAFVAIQALEDSDVVADCEPSDGDAQFDDTLTEGTTIYGNFNDLSVTSGKVIIYLV